MVKLLFLLLKNMSLSSKSILCETNLLADPVTFYPSWGLSPSLSPSETPRPHLPSHFSTCSLSTPLYTPCRSRFCVSLEHLSLTPVVLQVQESPPTPTRLLTVSEISSNPRVRPYPVKLLWNVTVSWNNDISSMSLWEIITIKVLRQLKWNR